MAFWIKALHWLHLHSVELLATLTGILYILYAIRKNILLWLFGIISSALFIWVFYQSSIYAYSILYIYYVIVGVYGWYKWSRPIDIKENPDNLTVHRTSAAGLTACIAVSFLFAFPVFLLLRKYSDSDAAWLDALLSSSGMVATWMLTRKMIEQWIFWIVIDVMTCSLMIYKGLYLSSILFAAYALLALKGYLEWKKELAIPGVK
jgi:nicotinamide mononucleotide transporter